MPMRKPETGSQTVMPQVAPVGRARRVRLSDRQNADVSNRQHACCTPRENRVLYRVGRRRLAPRVET